MAKTFSELQALALQIRDEILEKKNTAPRVGAALLDMIDNTIQNITDINQKLSVFEHVCSGFKRVQSESQLPVTPPEDEKAVGYLVGKNLYLYVGKDGNAVNGRYFNVGDITGPQGEPGPLGLVGPVGPKGEQGNSGVSGSTDNIEVVNNLDGGESTPERIKVLAAEQGKVLKEKLSELIDRITYTDILKNTNMVGSPIKSGNPVNITITNTGEKRSTIFFVAKNNSQQLGVLQEFGYKGFDPQQTLEFDVILPENTNTLIVGETQQYDCTYTVEIMSKKSLQYEVKQNTDKIKQHDAVIEEIESTSNTALSEITKLTESFNKFNPEEFILGQTINPNNGGMADSTGRMVYILKLSSPALSTDTIITNAYGCALMKEGKWLAKIDPIGGTIPKNLTEGADEIRLYFLNQNTTDKFLYINSDISKYLPYGKTLSEIHIEKNTSDIIANAENIEKNTSDIEELKKNSGNNGGVHPTSGSEFTTVGDSLCASNKWQAKLAELTGATHIGGYSTGGTKTYGYKEDCGQRRLIKLYSEHPNVPYIFLENINDMAKTMDDANSNIGDYNTDTPFMYETHSMDENVQNSYEEAIGYWDSNFDTFASSVSPQTGYIRVLKYKKAAFQLNVQGKATSDGTFNIVIGEDNYGIAVTTGMTIDDICDAILNYSFTGFTDTAVGSTNNYTGVKLTGDDTVSAETVVSIEENGTGVNIQVVNVASEAEILYYFNSLKVSDFTKKEKWKIEKDMSLASFYMGILQYVVTNFPTAKIYWMIMPRFGIDYSNLASYYKWENGVINTARYKGTGTEKAIRNLNNFQKEICDWYLIPYLDVERFCGINYYNASYYYPNGDVHPKEVGYNRWAETIYRLTYGM